MKTFCEKYPNTSIGIFVFLVSFCLFMSIVLLTAFMGIWADQVEMTDAMRDAIEHIPGFNKGIYC